MKPPPLTTYDAAYRYTLRLLQQRSYSRAMIETKLHQRQTPEAIIERVIAKLFDLHLLDDVRYSQNLTRSEALYRHTSTPFIKRKLKQKGVPDTVIQTALAEFDDAIPSEEERAAYHLERWRRKNGPPNTYLLRQKASAALFRKGFSLSVIQRVVAEGPTNLHDEEKSV